MRSLSGLYSDKRSVLSYLSIIGLIVTQLFFYKDGFGIRLPTNFDMPLNKETTLTSIGFSVPLPLFKPFRDCSKIRNNDWHQSFLFHTFFSSQAWSKYLSIFKEHNNLLEKRNSKCIQLERVGSAFLTYCRCRWCCRGYVFYLKI